MRIDGFVGGRRVLSRRFSSDSSGDRLSLEADDGEIVADGSDATRVVFRTLDRFGAPRPYVKGEPALKLEGPAVLVGDSRFAFEEAGGAGAIWVRTAEGRPGRIRVLARHPTLGNAEVGIRAL